VGILTASENSKLLHKADQMPVQARAIYKKAVRLREMMFQVFSNLAGGISPSLADVETLNAARTEALHHSRLSQTGKGLSLSWDESDSLERMLWPIILSASELLTSEAVHRLRECNGKGCDWLFIDSSRNHMRRWCSMDECGNRAKMHRRYHRKLYR
jgi:predicted RNA-binding Zn ribbon-like protein